jgi:hypothetical protein
MKKALFFVAGIAVGLCTSLVAVQGAGSIAVLNASGVYQVNTPRFRAKWA